MCTTPEILIPICIYYIIYNIIMTLCVWQETTKPAGINEVCRYLPLVNWTSFGDKNISTRDCGLCASRGILTLPFDFFFFSKRRRISRGDPQIGSVYQVLTPAGLVPPAPKTRRRHMQPHITRARRRMCSVVGGFIYQTGVDVRMIYLRTVIGRGEYRKLRSV